MKRSRPEPGRAAACALGLATFLGVLAVPTVVPAQISPGPLSKAHAELEGMRKCLECHGIGEPSLDDRCLACHGEIEWLRAQGRGLHGAADLDECATCHREHGGEDFEIVHWEAGGPDAFDHRRAGWTLEGKHADVACERCHREELRTAAVMGLRPGGASASTWLGLETACASCHADPHDARLGSDCAECHTARSFREILEGRFDHERTSYPLRGAHGRVDCAACHRTEAGWVQRPESSRCSSCHADPHRGRATIAGRAVDCAKCHVLDAFRPSTFTVAMHATGPYPLEGKHRAVACAACHAAGPETVELRPAHARCADCHADPHGGQLAARKDGGACESCHGTEGFTPSTFSVADHRDLPFSLRGRHAEATCRSCHGPDPRAPRAASVTLGKAGVLFRFPSTECAGCHSDPHEGRFAERGCLACHDHGGFRPSRVDVVAHAAYEFPLEGAHAAIPCLECHRDLDRDESAIVPLRFEVPRRECRDCHRDPHAGQFDGRAGGDACSACHGLDAFVPAARFDHGRDAGFPLEGAHARTACAHCHDSAPLADGSHGPRYRPVPRRCEDCHGGITP